MGSRVTLSEMPNNRRGTLDASTTGRRLERVVSTGNRGAGTGRTLIVAPLVEE
jgi:hypothetical protein